MSADVIITLARATTPENGVIKLEQWPEGYVLWYHGRIVWKSWFTVPGKPIRSKSTLGYEGAER